MAYTRRIRQALVVSLLLARASTTPAGRSTPTSASNSASSTASIPAGYTTAVIPIYLYDIAESLYTEYFPSTTPANLAAIPWPTQVVIGTATYGLKQDSPTNSQKGASPSNTAQRSSSTDAPQSNQGNDKEIAIIIGVVIGAVAIIIMAVLFFCLRRRRRDTGSFFMRRSTPSTSSTASRRAGAFGTQSYMSENPSNLLRDSGTPRAASDELVPDIIYHQSSSRSTLDDNPFYTPLERPSSHFDQHELAGVQATEPTTHNSSNAPRAATASFPPIMMQQMPVNSQHPPQNPFSSPEDREADDVVSPILPARSFERKGGSPILHSMVHYPSMSEVSEFDFAEDGRRQAGARNQSTWHPSREKLDGRHELA